MTASPAENRPDPPPPDVRELAAEVAALRAEVRRLNGHRFFRIQNSLPRLLLYQFTNGVMTGLGTVIGATLLVSALIYFLAQIELIPIIGNYATRIIEQIDRDPTP